MEDEVANFEMGDEELQGAGLAVQDLEKLKIEELTPLTHEVISRQATINIGTIGHVAHGKSTVVKAISSVKTVKFKKEMVNNITIKLGYANAKIFQVEDTPRPQCYVPGPSSAPDNMLDEATGKKMNLVRHVSFVDCPGHDILMATMLNGAAIMDAALLLIAGNEPCPQPQTSEHLAAVEIMKLTNIIILQNKIDLVEKSKALAQYEDIKRFVKGGVADGAPIIPISAQLKYNIDVVCEYIVKHIPIPRRNFIDPPRLIVVRSFDVNKPGEAIEKLQGGVAGGTILKGVLKKGQEIEVRPGLRTKNADGSFNCVPIRSQVLSLFTESNPLEYAVPGGLVGVGTRIDPALAGADRLVGQVLGTPKHLPEIYQELEIHYFLLRTLLGVAAKTESGGGKVSKLQKDEIIMMNIGSLSTGGRIVAVKGEFAKLVLTIPVCTDIGEKLALSRRVDRHWRLIGWGQIRRGVPVNVKY